MEENKQNIAPEFEKTKKNVKNDLIILSALQAFVFAVSFITTVETNVFNAAYAVLLYWGHLEAKKGNKSAGIVGVIFGILMILTILVGDLIDPLLGIFLVVHSSKYLKYFKN